MPTPEAIRPLPVRPSDLFLVVHLRDPRQKDVSTVALGAAHLDAKYLVVTGKALGPNPIEPWACGQGPGQGVGVIIRHRLTAT